MPRWWRRSRRRAKGETAKYEVYVSDAKLDLIYDQLPKQFWRRCLREGVARA